MEVVLSVSELLAAILSCWGLGDEIIMIAKMRMVCRRYRDSLATVVGTETRTRAGVAYTATTYTVLDLFGCTRYWASCEVAQRPHNPCDRRYFLEEVQVYGDRCITDCAAAAVIHAWEDVDGYHQAGFTLDWPDFIDLNRLFGVPAAAYGLLARRAYGIGRECAIRGGGVDLLMEVNHKWHILWLYLGVDRYAAYYCYAGRVYGCEKNVGDFRHVQLLERLTW